MSINIWFGCWARLRYKGLMAYRIIQVHADSTYQNTIEDIKKDPNVVDSWPIEAGATHLTQAYLVKTQNAQTVMDKIQTFIGEGEPEDYIGVDKQAGLRMILLPVETVYPPHIDENSPRKPGRKTFAGISREELYEDISREAELTRSFFFLVVCSTIAAAIGLIEDNVAVVIGSMVIAPFLGPNLALALAAALGDTTLMKQAVKTNLGGLLTTLALSFLIGFFWPYGLESGELYARTYVGMDSIILALVAGAAGVLSLTRGTASVLVGVMVAVALLPPAASLGIFLGAGYYYEASGAALMLLVNVVSVNLAAKLVFWFKGVKPRSWTDQKRASRAMLWYVLFWVVTLAALVTAIYFRESQVWV